MKQYVPKWVRIQRIQRNVPAKMICSGVKKSNLRQIVEKELQAHGKTCNCIRCREIGHKSLQKIINFDDLNLELIQINYKASGGTEIFLSIEDKKYNVIAGFLRLRDVILPHRYELIKEPCMIIRELKVLGKEVAIGKKSDKGVQHKGLGQDLIEESERICLEEFDKKKLFILSGIGVKQYYRKLGYANDGVYVSKYLK